MPHLPIIHTPPAAGAVGNILVTDEAGFAVYANEGIAQKTGFSVAEIIDSKPGKLWGGRMPRSFYDRMWHTLRDRQSTFVGTVTNRAKTGREYEELLAVVPLENAGGSPRKYLALRPSNLAESERFLVEWRETFSSLRVSAKTVLPWLQHWFPAETGVISGQTGAFSDWVDRHWVAAIRERFQRRIDDRTLIEKAQHDPARFQELYEKYFDTVRSYFMRHLPGNHDQVSDLTQDTFIRAFERLEGYETRNAAYGTYLLRIAHSLLLNSFRRQPMVELSPDQPDPSAALPLVVETDWIWETPELSTRERVVLSAYYREGYSVREISERLGHSENATKLLLSRARKKLRPLLGSS